jgi:hypothetical protein
MLRKEEIEDLNCIGNYTEMYRNLEILFQEARNISN